MEILLKTTPFLLEDGLGGIAGDLLSTSSPSAAPAVGDGCLVIPGNLRVILGEGGDTCRLVPLLPPLPDFDSVHTELVPVTAEWVTESF